MEDEGAGDPYVHTRHMESLLTDLAAAIRRFETATNDYDESRPATPTAAITLFLLNPRKTFVSTYRNQVPTCTTK